MACKRTGYESGKENGALAQLMVFHDTSVCSRGTTGYAREKWPAGLHPKGRELGKEGSLHSGMAEALMTKGLEQCV